MFKNKRILLICKETYSYPLFFLGERWKSDNKVAAFFFNPTECMYKESFLNKYTYYQFKRSGYCLYNSSRIATKFISMTSNKIYNQELLENIENNYTHFRNVNQQIMSTQYLTRYYHFRNYMSDCTYEQQLNWLCLNYENVMEILDDFRPDVIIDIDTAELARMVTIEVAYKRDIPYITVEWPKYEMYKTYTYRLGIGVDKYFVNKYHEMNQLSEKDFETELTYIDAYRKKMEIMPVEYSNDVTSQYNADSILTIAKRLYGKLYYFYEQDYKTKNKQLKDKSKILFNNSKEYIKFYFRVEISRRKFLKKNTLFEPPVQGEKYIYMPLHLIPESTTFGKAPFYVNELQIIEAVSKALPAGWRLYVKEHQAMLGERGIDFYKKVKRLPNARLVQINYYKDPKPWIVNAQGVVTITGTTAYEAALLGKPALVFGDVMFGLIDGVTKVNNIEELPSLFKNFRNIDNRLSCARYIRAVKECGKPINIKYLMSEGEKVLREKKGEYSDEYLNELNMLEKLFEDAYLNYSREEV